MNATVTAWLLSCFLVLCAVMGINAGGHGGHHHVVIKIPEHIHTVKHTHTIYKTIHHHHKEPEHHHSHGGHPFHWKPRH
ncbi:unnamed protein product [Callosobruchus maculatus]|uniref:Histidine-rich glycoprotein n=1 Tax=Callosobruchus maculatus TaxID=64391 RepID=A0A653CDZ3_CALMS|nr:unnamed protein product [Callosobruchus maculatus]